MTEKEFSQIRGFVLEEMKKIYSSPTVSLWFEPMKVVALDDKSVTVTLPQNRKSFVEAQYYDILREKLSEIIGFKAELVLISEEEYFETYIEPEKEPESAYKMRFNPDYTFENFVVGKSNQLAQSASLAVANDPAKLNNPLFLYGNSGLGKTHLLFAIVNTSRETHPNFNILYVTGEEFLNELIESLAKKKSVAFREKYRNLDVLLVDDIQFIAGKLTVQEEFFHTFDTLFKMNKQIILASDRAPKDIDNLEDRLESRFVMGLVTDIQPPDLDLRVAIFKRKSIDMGFDLDSSVLYFLARNITTNIRQIEGSLKKLRAHTLVTGQRVDYNVAKAVLSDFFANAKSEESTIDRIFEYTEKRYGITKDEMKSSKRNADIAAARHTTMYLIRKTTNLSQSSIAKIFNKKDHTTVINSISTVERKMLNDPGFEREIKQAIASLI